MNLYLIHSWYYTALFYYSLQMMLMTISYTEVLHQSLVTQLYHLSPCV